MKTSKSPSLSSVEASKLGSSSLSYSVVLDAGRLKPILQDCNTCFHLGEMSAIMGPSGSGKSTLLDLLAGRKQNGVMSGEVLLNGRALPNNFQLNNAYVPQNDLHCPLLTVEETLRFAAWLRMEGPLSEAAITARVAFVLDLMALSSIRCSLIGDTTNRGISGGQLKRLSIGAELINLPEFLFLDEPTSGLDSNLAREVVSCVKSVSRQGRVCICTIHQPSRETFEAFDSIVLLAEGRLLFCGPVSHVMDYFFSLGVDVPHAADGFNPAIFLIDICCGTNLVAVNNTEQEMNPQRLSELFKQSSFYQAVIQDVEYIPRDSSIVTATVEEAVVSYGNAAQLQSRFTEEVTVECVRTNRTDDLSSRSIVGAARENVGAASPSRQFFVLLHRHWTTTSRNTPEIWAQVAKSLAVSSLIGALLYQQGKVKLPLFIDGIPQESVNSVNSLLFFAMAYVLAGNAEAIPALAKQNNLFLRERAANRYGTGPYFLSHMIGVLPWMAAYHLLFVAPYYLLCGFPLSLGYFLYFSGILMLGNVAAYYFAAFLVAATGSAVTSFGIFPFSIVFFVNFTGYTISLKDLPAGWSWAPFISYSRWIFEGLMLNQWNREPFTSSSTANHSSTGTGDGPLVIAHYGFVYGRFNEMDCLFKVALFAIVSALAAYLAMLPTRRTKRMVMVDDVTSLAGVSSWNQRLKNVCWTPWSKLLERTNRFISFSPKPSNKRRDYLGRRKGSSFPANDLEEALLPRRHHQKYDYEKQQGAVHIGSNSAQMLESDTSSDDIQGGGDGNEYDGSYAFGEGDECKEEVLPGPVRNSSAAVDQSGEESKWWSEVKNVGRTHRHAHILHHLSMVDHTSRERAPLLESRGCELVFDHITYETRTSLGPKSTARLLFNVSGYACPGQLVAIMGASGAGKTTLLDILAGRQSHGKIGGHVYLNGQERGEEFASPSHLSSAYVMQDSVHIPELTVRETLQYAARLRLDESMPAQDREDRVEHLLEMLDLTGHADTIVGDERCRGISGGQRKRLSISVEIIHMPYLLFLDEPTTGLDSAQALELIVFTRAFSDWHRTVLCTIHQPSAQLLKLFDSLLLLSSGRVIYFGPCDDAVKFFTSPPFEFAYDAGCNPAEFVIAVASGSITAADGLKISSAHLAMNYEESKEYAVVRQTITALLGNKATQSVGRNSSSLRDASLFHSMLSPIQGCFKLVHRKSLVFLCLHPYPTSTWNQGWVLCRRVVHRATRDKWPYLLTTFRHVGIGLFYGSLFSEMDKEISSPTRYTNRLSLLFFVLNFLIITHQQSIPALIDSRRLYYQEKAAHCYGALPYWLSVWFLQVPLASLNVMVFCGILFSLTGLEGKEPDKFWFSYGVMLLSSLTGLFLSQFVAAIMPSAQAAVSAIPIAHFTNIAFAGYIVYISSLAQWLRYWAPFLSFLRFSFQSLVLSEFQDNEKLPFGQLYLHILGFDEMSRYECIPIMLIFMGAFAIGLLIVLRYVNYDRL